MTNEQKYKTLKERINAFRKFCKENDCRNCPINGAGEMMYQCALGWIALEAEEEEKPEPMPCPYCKGIANIMKVGGVYRVKCARCGYTSANRNYPDDAIAAHNRVCRAVKAYNESEVVK